MDAARSDRAALITNMGGGLMGLVFAAIHPDRLRALVIVDGWAMARVGSDYPIGLAPEEVRRRVEQTDVGWGKGFMLDSFAPSMRSVPGLREAWARYERFAASPGVARAMIANLLDAAMADTRRPDRVRAAAPPRSAVAAVAAVAFCSSHPPDSRPSPPPAAPTCSQRQLRRFSVPGFATGRPQVRGERRNPPLAATVGKPAGTDGTGPSSKRPSPPAARS